MLKKVIFLILIALGCAHGTSAQYYQEFGVMGGPVFFKSDFGARNDFENFVKNDGFSIGAFYYLTFVEDYPNIRENFKIRLEGSYMKSELQHYGQYVDNKSNSLFTQQLRAMRGSVKMGTFGVQVEYYPFKVDDYNRGSDWSPFVALGAQANSYTAEVYSELGELGTEATTPVKYMNAYRNGGDFVASVTASVGTRYKLGYYHALIAEVRLQYFFSDWVDGLNPDPNVYKENKANDYSGGLTLGYIYYIN